MNPAMAGRPTQGAAPSQQPLAPNDLPGLLLDAQAVGSVMNSPALSDATSQALADPRTAPTAPPQCAGAVQPGDGPTYATSGSTGTASSVVADPGDPNTTVIQYLAGYPSADDAARQQDSQINAWRGCENTTVSVTDNRGPHQLAMGPTESVDGRLTITFTEPGRACQHVLSTDSNVVIDVQTCTPTAGGQADQIAVQIADKIH
jgi:hypothetical protein